MGSSITILRLCTRIWLASWVGDLCSHRGPCAQMDPSLGLMPSHQCPKILNTFEQEALHFHLALSPTDYLSGKGKSSLLFNKQISMDS